jgi:enamine deaminase RidA (YjgF/YER057c/UK114 family)
MKIHRREQVADQFSRIVIFGNTVYFAGLVADDANGSFEQQCAEVFNKLDGLLERSGANKKSLLTTTVYLKSFDDYDEFRSAWANWLGSDALPARATVQAELRDSRLRIEIQAIAAISVKD